MNIKELSNYELLQVKATFKELKAEYKGNWNKLYDLYSAELKKANREIKARGM